MRWSGLWQGVDVFKECRERVSVPDVALHYGFTSNRAGFICCPFHHEKTPSLKLNGHHWHCFGCGAGGSSIDFVSQLLGLDALGAVERLNADFNLGLPLHRNPTPAERDEAQRRRQVAEAHKQFEEWRKALCVKACEAYRVAHHALQGDTSRLSERETMAVQWQAYHEYLADALTIGEPEEQMEIFRDRQVIESRIDQILNNTPMKSNVA